ncbi:MAG: hypothetical protein R2705_10685, partial [Ilumatobacteraceae bacterium]
MLALTVAGLLSLAMVPLSADAAVAQQKWFDGALKHTSSSYPQVYPHASAAGNTWGPYQNGHVYARVEISGKPSSYAMGLQMCLWKHGAKKYQYEACSLTLYPFSNDGVIWMDLGTPTNGKNWWTKPQPSGPKW